MRLFEPLHGTDLAWAIAGCLGFSAVAFALLQLLPGRSRRWLIIGCTFLAGCFFALEFFWPVREVAPGVSENFLTKWKESVGYFVTIMAGFAIGLGVVNLCSYHAKSISGRRSGWENSVVFFVGLVGMLMLGVWNVQVERTMGGMPPEAAEAFGNRMKFITEGYDFFFNGLFQPLGATMFSVLAFFIVSAAYRAFRIRTAEAALMSIAAFLVMLSMVPLGMAITSGIPPESQWAGLRLENIGRWIMTVINMSTIRAINFGVAVGGLAMALRIWLSLERGAYFDQRM